MSSEISESLAQEQFSKLLRVHRKMVFKVANTYARHPEDRADLAQEIAAQLWRAFPAYDPGRSFSTWMYRIALNVAISHMRSATRHAAHNVPLDGQLHETVGGHRAADGDADERVRALYDFIEGLEALDRALLLLYLEEHTYSDIAGILGITETNVATKISRLKQRIRSEMKG